METMALTYLLLLFRSPIKLCVFVYILLLVVVLNLYS